MLAYVLFLKTVVDYPCGMAKRIHRFTTSFRVGMAEGIENGGCTVNQILVNSCDSDVMKMAD